jgi:molybdopterin-guanine dinucleotide biosynthesis protein B
MPKLVAVVGGKHSGKTTVIEHLLRQLKGRGYRVGVVKEMVRIPSLDTPEKETDRYTEAGAETIVAVPRNETVVFLKRRLSLNEILPYMQGLNFVLLEGFEKEKTLPKIITAKTVEDVVKFLDDSAIAISGILTETKPEPTKDMNFPIPMLNGVRQAKELADIVEKVENTKS